MTIAQYRICKNLFSALNEASENFRNDPDYFISWTGLRRLAKPLNLNCAELKYLFMCVSHGFSFLDFLDAVRQIEKTEKCVVVR